MKQTRKYAYIDAMRGGAILLVILIHVAQSLQHREMIMPLARLGQFGVQLFFVASALTLCLSYQQRLNEPHRLQSFLLRRWFRIAPLYMVGILVYMGISAFRDLYLGQSVYFSENYTVINVLANLFMLHAFLPAANNEIVPGGWSIATEVIFYYLFPFLFFHLDSLRRIVLALLASLSILLAVSLYFGMNVENNSFLYYSFAIQLPVFLFGFLLYRLLAANTALPMSLLVASALPLLLLIYYWRLAPVSYLLAPAAAGLLFCALGLWLSRISHFPELLTEIGRRSFSMYIFHFIAAWFLVPAIDQRITQGLGPVPSLLVNYCVVAVLSYHFSAFSYTWIEKRFVRLGNEFIERRQNMSAPRT